MPASEGMAVELLAMLEEIKRIGSGQDSVRLAHSIVSMAEGNVDVCETFFVQFRPDPSSESSDLFSLFLDTVAGGSCDEELMTALLSVLSVAVRHCGLGVARLRAMLEMLIHDGGWSTKAVALLTCMHEMVTPLDAEVQLPLASAYAAAPVPVSSGVNWYLRNGEHFFILNGEKSGLCLGGDGPWAWENGYAWATSFWWDKSVTSPASRGADRVIFRMVAGEEDAKKQTVVAEVLLRGHTLIIGIRDGSKKLEVQCPMELRPG
eukprot:2321461-Rhodomonas_salina.1